MPSIGAAYYNLRAISIRRNNTFTPLAILDSHACENGLTSGGSSIGEHHPGRYKARRGADAWLHVTLRRELHIKSRHFVAPPVQRGHALKSNGTRLIRCFQPKRRVLLIRSDVLKLSPPISTAKATPFAAGGRNPQALSRAGYFLALRGGGPCKISRSEIILLRYAMTRHIFPDRENTP